MIAGLLSSCHPDAMKPLSSEAPKAGSLAEEGWLPFEYPEWDVPPLRDSSPMTGLALFHTIWSELERGEAHDWQDKHPYLLWSAVVASDSMVAIGYKPGHVEAIDWETYDPRLEDWRYAKAYTIGFILKELNQGTVRDTLTEQDVVVPFYEHLPILHVRLHDYSMLAKLKQLETIRYVAPHGYVPEAYLDTVARSGSSSGCLERTDISTANDLSFVFPNSAVSWHIGNNSVPSSGSTSITIDVTVTEQGGLGRNVSSSLYVPVRGGGGTVPF
jgi:hypothetical protein